MSNDPRVNKVYKVTFNEMLNGEEQIRVDSTKVIAKDVALAMEVAKKKLNEEDGKRYFIGQIELITYLD